MDALCQLFFWCVLQLLSNVFRMCAPNSIEVSLDDTADI